MFRVEKADEDLQIQRNRLIRSLDEKFTFLNLKGMVVFDAHFQEGTGVLEYAKSLDIFYTAHSQTADEAILELLKGLKPASWIIVTSDKRLAWKVRRNAFKTESVEQFLSWLKKRLDNRRKKQTKNSSQPRLTITKTKGPTLQALPEDCFDYYLEIFNKEPEPEQAKKGTKLKKKRVVLEEEPIVSDFERWLKAFGKDELGDRGDR